MDWAGTGLCFVFCIVVFTVDFPGVGFIELIMSLFVLSTSIFNAQPAQKRNDRNQMISHFNLQYLRHARYAITQRKVCNKKKISR